ncbi:protein WAX2, partial [Trifolium pratense]
MNIKVVDGSSLVVATVLNSIAKGTNEVLLRGKFNKIALAIVNALCSKNVQ